MRHLHDFHRTIMTPLFVERVARNDPHGGGYEQYEQQYRHALGEGREVRIEAGRRAEFDVAAGERAVVYVMEGGVRFEGDDTAAGPGDVVVFRRAEAGEDAKVAMEADTPFVGVLVTGGEPPAR
jgi:redox-sensitive bicupin YhaK (pirin superfamily)